ncbi:MAG TPA: glycosyltransferase family 4 protein [Longimicrobiaceae bacterium]|nr:glycosyltransferase family 4 protein [Longimicrobiaceae bacterium]
MRVLITTDTVGGVWEYTTTLATALEAYGHAVMVAVIGKLSDGRAAALPAAAEVRVRPFRLEWMADAESDVEAAGEWLRELALEWRPDLVHLNQFGYAPAGFGAPTIVVAHSDVYSWFSEVQHREAPVEWAPYRQWVRDGLAAADFVVAPSGYQSDLLQRHYGRAADRIIWNGASVPPSGEVPKERLAVSAGRAWDEAKGMSVLDAALAGRTDPPVYVLGDTTAPEGSSFNPRNVLARGRMERVEMGSWLDLASVYVSPSLYEPFGLAPLEAAFHGCALLLSDIGSFRELWDGCADFFEPGDPVSLGAGLTRLFADSDHCARRADQARRRANERYTADRMVDGYLKLYHDLQLTGAGMPGSSDSGVFE